MAPSTRSWPGSSSQAVERAMRSYTNRSLDAAGIIVELVELAKQLREERDRGSKLSLREDELAFYDAVCQTEIRQ